MSDEKSKKIKDMIKVLSDLLDSKEPEADTNSATLASDLPGPSTPTQPSDRSQEAISRPLSACDRALETLRRLRQSEQARNFEPYAAEDRSRGKSRKRSSSICMTLSILLQLSLVGLICIILMICNYNGCMAIHY